MSNSHLGQQLGSTHTKQEPHLNKKAQNERGICDVIWQFFCVPHSLLLCCSHSCRCTCVPSTWRLAGSDCGGCRGAEIDWDSRGGRCRWSIIARRRSRSLPSWEKKWESVNADRWNASTFECQTRGRRRRIFLPPASRSLSCTHLQPELLDHLRLDSALRRASVIQGVLAAHVPEPHSGGALKPYWKSVYSASNTSKKGGALQR